MVTALDMPITNEYECPLVNLTNSVLTIPSQSIVIAVSVIHQCTEVCTFLESGTRRTIKREHVTATDNSLVFKHD